MREGELSFVAFAPSGGVLLAGDHGAAIWDARSGREMIRFQGHQGALYSAAFSPDGRSVAMAGEEGRVYRWDLDGTSLGEPLDAGGWVNALAFSTDGAHLLAVSPEKNRAIVFDIEAGKKSAEVEVKGLRSAAFRLGAAEIITLDEKGHCVAWGLQSKPVNSRKLGEFGKVDSAIFSADGSRVLIRPRRFGEGFLVCEAYWGRCLGDFWHGQGLALNANGSKVIMSDEKEVAVMDVATGKRERTLASPGGRAYAAALNDKASRLVFSDIDSARLWRIGMGEEDFKEMRRVLEEKAGSLGGADGEKAEDRFRL